jgi:PST family polysaccharide transporter
VNLLSTALRRVSIPYFAQLRDQGRAMKDAFPPALGLVALTVTPVCLLLGLLAEPLVRTLYGDRWAAAAPVLVWLAAFALVRVLIDLCWDVLVAIGRSRTTVVLQLLWLAGLLVALPVGASAGGIRGVAIGHVVVGVAVVIPAFLVALAGSGIRAGDLGRRLVAPALGAGAGAAGGLFAGTITDGGLAELALVGSVGLGAYVVVAVPRDLARTGARELARRATRRDNGPSTAHGGPGGEAEEVP